MKRKFITVILFFAIFFVILSIIACFSGFLGKSYNNLTPSTHKNESYDAKKTVKLKTNDETLSLPLNEYLYGVVAAEMPASFEEEALKAQAVAARTETVKKMSQKNDVHKNADVCDNINHCQAYYKEAELKEKYGDEWMRDFYPKIKKSVDETDGITAVYNDEPISAVFHSTSSGMTENSKDVWGGDMPYLVSVKSDGEEDSPRYFEEKSFTINDFKSKLSKIKKTDFSGEPESWIKSIKRNESGSVNEINVCDTSFKGTQIRSALDLRSTNFEIEISKNSVTISTKGYGHGVGMSQYGANYMAKNGYTYEDILKKYYTGISLKTE